MEAGEEGDYEALREMGGWSSWKAIPTTSLPDGSVGGSSHNAFEDGYPQLSGAETRHATPHAPPHRQHQ